MNVTKKLCWSCETLQYIWKNNDGHKYCQSCWNKQKPKKAIEVRTPVKKISDKRKTEQSIYSIQRKIFLIQNPYCKGKISGCSSLSTEVHHMKGRVGSLYLDQRYWLPLCNNCHHWVETHPDEAKELGLSLSRLNNETPK